MAKPARQHRSRRYRQGVTWTWRRSLGLSGVRMTARAQPELKFTSLLHHVHEQLLHKAFFDLKKTAAVGIDEVKKPWETMRQ